MQQFDEVISSCRAVFAAKTADYGTSWRIFRLPSLTDQLYIKATRIRNLEQLGESKVDEGPDEEYRGIINYCLIGLVQLGLEADAPEELALETALSHYDREAGIVRDLLSRKNHDYGEVWREMRVSSMTDMILVKLRRIKQIEDNAGSTLVSEGIGSHYQDIINYAVFALIKRMESNEDHR